MVDQEEQAGRAAADRLAADWPKLDWAPVDPSDAWARGAVERFGELVRNQLPIFRASQANADRKAATLSPRPFQGLSETLQNANDLGATVVRIAFRSRPRPELLLVHDGRPVRLKDMGAMVLPWVSSKDDDDEASGRFGIGQKTLLALGGPLSLHCAPYHFEMRAERPVVAEPAPAIAEVYDPARRETLLVVPLSPKITLDRVRAAAAEMGVESLLFLDAVRRLEFIDLDAGGRVERYEIEVGAPLTVDLGLGKETLAVDVTDIAVVAPAAEAERRFKRYWALRPTPEDQERSEKGTGVRTPLGLCIEQGGDGHGHLFDKVRMPVKMRFPISLNAQFDPDAARTTVLPVVWNEARLQDLGDFLGSAALHAFENDPAVAWSYAPLLREFDDEGGWLAERLREDVAERTRERLASDLWLADQDGNERPLDEFVYECAALDGLLTPEDQVVLNPAAAVVTMKRRDRGGRWRDVLSELELSRELDFEDALEIFQHPERLSDRGPDWFVAMAALAGRQGSINALLLRPAILLADGRVIRAPVRGGTQTLVESAAVDALALKLGLALPIHPAYLADTADASAAREALTQIGLLVASMDQPEDALALLGRAPSDRKDDPKTAVEVTDVDLVAIRDAWERTPGDHQRDLAGRIGRNIRIRAARYEGKKDREVWARPVTLYMPGSIDKGGSAFAKVAGRTPGLLWAADNYAAVLRQAAGRQAVGAQRFLSALGVARSPRLTPPADEGTLYSRDNRKVSPLNAATRPSQQTRAIRQLEAGYVMNDRWSRDLDAVIDDIQTAPAKVRRQRALGLLSLLARRWDRRYADHESADAVSAFNGAIKVRGNVQATWLARLAEAAWLPNGANGFAAPKDLCLPTPANKLAHPNNRAAFLASVPSEVATSGLLIALGVQPGPTTDDLIARLRAYRGVARTPAVVEQVHGIYQLLADNLRPSRNEAALGRSLSATQLRNAFRATTLGPGLILSHDGWHSPDAVLAGPPVFGTLRAFAPHVAGLEPLWERLGLRKPGPADCAQVLRDLAVEPLTPERRGLMLTTMQELARTLAQASPQLRTALKTLPLWTGHAWARTRPGFVFEGDSLLDADIAGAVVWRPGLSSLKGLEALLPVLGVTPLRLEDFQPVRLTTLGVVGGRPHRERYARAVSLLEQALIRADVGLHQALGVGWEALQTAEFLIEPELEIEAVVGPRSVKLPVGAHVATDPVRFAALSLALAGDSQAGGQAIASLFNGDRQKVAWAWSSVWMQALEETAQTEIVLPQLKPSAGGGLPRLERLKSQAEERAKGKTKTTVGEAGDKSETTATSKSVRIEVRQLRDLTMLEPAPATIVNAGVSRQGVIFPKAPTQDLSRTFEKHDGDAKPGKLSKRSVLPPADDREAMALDAIRRALELDPEQFRDVRQRRGLGFDAITDLRDCFELKMTSGPNFRSDVTLEASQVKAALEDPDFFLALVAGLEDGEGELRVRFITRPLEVLQTRIPAQVTLTGVDGVEALEYRFVKAGSDKPERDRAE